MRFHVSCQYDPARLPKASPTVIPVQMYARSSTKTGVGVIGAPVFDEIRRLRVKPEQLAFDFLSIALAVTAADTFIDRNRAADAWAREIRLTVSVANPVPWKPLRPMLETALRFLSGDIWALEIVGNGRGVPQLQKRGVRISVQAADSVSLFSGGLDSTIGALDLLATGRRPALVSHAYTSDQTRQQEVYGALPTKLPHFSASAHPIRPDADHDVTMRTRSFNFIAFGVVVASCLAKLGKAAPITLFIPENGVISLNPPLTIRRLGSLSTRTTHPYFLGILQKILSDAGLPVRLVNPYRFATKGEMMSNCQDDQTLRQVSHRTVSCGKWKRLSKQCGRCVPCLIRRAAFRAAKIRDRTKYRFDDLSAVLADENERDDLLAMTMAIQRVDDNDLPLWVAQGGPLPTDGKTRASHVDVFARGMAEMKSYLASQSLIS